MNWRIAQDPAYHLFADRRAFLGIDNAANTLSGLAFLVASAPGLFFLSRERASGGSGRFAAADEMRAYWILFCAIALTAFGSAYYRLAPDDARLMWDRLPMSLGFMALLSATITDRVSTRAGVRLLVPLLLAGAGSVIYWCWRDNYVSLIASLERNHSNIEFFSYRKTNLSIVVERAVKR